jgi:hypothetical protein
LGERPKKYPQNLLKKRNNLLILAQSRNIEFC